MIRAHCVESREQRVLEADILGGSRAVRADSISVSSILTPLLLQGTTSSRTRKRAPMIIMFCVSSVCYCCLCSSGYAIIVFQVSVHRAGVLCHVSNISKQVYA